MSGVNINGFLKSLDEYSKRQKEAIARSVGKFAEDVLSRAVELCPEDTGALRDSATKGDVVTTATDIFCTIGFNTNYAAAVHEILDNHHPKGGGPKYLENAMREMAGQFKDYVEEELREEFGD